MEARPPGSSLTRIRTFRDDLARASQGAPATPSESTPLPAAPTPIPPIAKSVAPTPVPPPPRPAPAARSVPRPATPPTRHMEDAARELATIDAKRRASVLATDDDAFDVRMAHDSGAEGAIVTDHKRDRFKLVPAVTAAFHDWLFEKREDLAKELEPKHTVAPAAERKDVIARAAEGGVIAPKNDYDTVATRLRHVPRVKVSVKPTVRDAAEVPQPSWHTVDEAVPTVPATPASTPRTFTPRPAPVPHLEEEPKPAPKPVLPEPPAPAPEPPPPPVVEAAPVLRNETPAPVRAPRPSPAPSEPSRRRALPYALIGIALIATLAGSGVVYLVSHQGGGTPSGTQPVALPTNGIPVPLATSHDAFVRALSDAMTSADRVGISWLVPIAEDGAPANPDEVLTTLALHAPGAFTRSVSVLRFGSADGSPFIVMTVSNYDTGLGGMLAWEDAIVDDFAPLFGAPVTASRAPTATSTTATAPTFTDITHANRDLRVLYDENGTERVSYTFLDRTTILITTSPTAIDAIAPAVQE